MMARPCVKYTGDKIPSRSDLRVEGTPGRVIKSKDNKETGPLRFGTWNVRTLQSAVKMENLKKEMDNCGIDVMGLSEVRRKGQGEIMSEDFTLYYSGGDGEGRAERGVAVMVRNKMVKSVVNVNCVSDRLMSVKLKAVPVDILVVQVYMPTSSHEESELEQIYDEIEDILNQEGKGKVNVGIMGDFNSVVGEGPEEKIVGTHGLGKRNVRGNMLVDFCRRHDLMVTNTWFKKRKTKLYTWKSPGDINRYQIDYVLVKHRFRNSVKDVRTFPGADIDSDHNMLAADIQTKLKNIRKTIGKKIRWNLEN
uniref:Putative endonuclease-reverse transcriptase n=1 Tax=Xenopsylla cheopis TaxID=163159 RepID=A0A6M2DQT5_XENCH